eukprot:evm.model.scf_318.4 EVM.evm.TU.scf_318.4   scf_318:17952-19678(+)
MFITEFFSSFIARGMEDPEARAQKWKEHMAIHEGYAQKRLARWREPVKVYGYWDTQAARAKHLTHIDPSIAKLPGRAPVMQY